MSTNFKNLSKEIKSQPLIFTSLNDYGFNNHSFDILYDYGDYIKQWNRPSDVEEILKYNRDKISACANGDLKKAFNFQWKKKNNINEITPKIESLIKEKYLSGD